MVWIHVLFLHWSLSTSFGECKVIVEISAAIVFRILLDRDRRAVELRHQQSSISLVFLLTLEILSLLEFLGILDPDCLLITE